MSSPSALLADPHLHDLQIQTYLYGRVETNESKLLSDVVVGWTKFDHVRRFQAGAFAMHAESMHGAETESRELRAETAPNPFRDLSDAHSLSITFRL